MKKRRWWLVVVALMGTFGAGAGIDPSLKQKLATLPQTEHLGVIVKLDLPTPAPGTMTPEAAIAYMRSTAAEAAKNVVAVLDEARGTGAARNVKLLWLAGVVSADVTPDLVHRVAVAKNVLGVTEDVLLDDDVNDGDTSGPNPNVVPEYFLTAMHVPEVWQAGYTGRNVVVAHIDTGVRSDHPDLADHVWDNPGETPGDGIDNDGNGYVDDVHGWNFKNNNSDTSDWDSHGTWTAGLVCGDGAMGHQTGAAPDIQLMILVRGDTQTSAWSASEYAVEKRVRIISQAYSIKWSDRPMADMATWRRHAERELAAGVIHIQSGGNTGSPELLPTNPVPYNVTTPGNCPPPYLHAEQPNPGRTASVVTVGSLVNDNESLSNAPWGPSDWSDIRASHPEYPYDMPPEYQDYPYTGVPLSGLLKPDVSAFGALTLTTSRTCNPSDASTCYANVAGTSAAASYTSGIVALLVEARLNATPAELTHALYASAVKNAPGWDVRRGEGRVDAYAALQWILQNVPPPDADDDGYSVPEDCNDNDPSIHPNAAEHCNGIDDDCDGTIDEDTVECNDGNACTTDQCVALACTHVSSGFCGVSGSVTYYRTPDANGDGSLDDPLEPSAKPVSGVKVIRTQTRDVAQTGPDGSWSLPNVSGDVSLVPDGRLGTPRADSGAEGSITSYDALLIARSAVELDVLTPLQTVSADVSGNGRVSAYDASIIAQYAVSLLDHFPVSTQRASDWAFVRCDGTLATCAPGAPDPGNPAFDFLPIDGPKVANWYGVLYGDVSGNWPNPPSLRGPLAGEAALPRAPAPGETVRLMSSPRASAATLTVGSVRRLPNGKVAVVIDLRDADGIQALDLALVHDASVTIEQVSALGLAAGYGRTMSDREGRCRVALFGTRPMRGSGHVLEVIATMPGKAVRAPFSVEATANEGLVPLTITR